MRLPVRGRSYAVLIGTARYNTVELPDLPAVSTNLADLAAALTNPVLGWLDEDRCFLVEDPTDVRAVYRTLADAAAAAEDTLLVYFAGHGRVGRRNELFLGLTDTDPDELPVSALAYDMVRDVVADSPAANRVVVLDCCFSGRAVSDMAGDVAGQLGIEGTYVLTATPPTATALAPLGARHTAFTGLLLRLLRTGVQGAPDLLSLALIHRELVKAAADRGLPRPQQRGTGTSQNLALTRNAAHITTPTITATPPQAPPRRSTRRASPRWGKTALTMVIVTGLVSGIALAGSAFVDWVTSTTLLNWIDPTPVSTQPRDPRQIAEVTDEKSEFVVYSPGGKLAIGHSDSLMIKTFDDQFIPNLFNHRDLKTAAFSADDRLLAVSSWDSGVYLYEVDDRRITGGPIGRPFTEALAFNSDNTLLAMSYEPVGQAHQWVLIWDLAANRPHGIVKPVDNEVTGLAFHPTDPNVLAVESSTTTQLWNARTRVAVADLMASPSDIHLRVEGEVTFSADGALLVANGTIWSPDRHAPACDPDVTEGGAAALSPDGRTAAVRGEDGTRLLDVKTCSWIGEPFDYMSDLAFSPDGRVLAAAEYDDGTFLYNVAR